MPTFRKKPVVTEAEQFFHKGDAGVTRMWSESKNISGAKPCERCGQPLNQHGKVPTEYRSCNQTKRYHTACPGDWIITGVKGEKYPCKPDTFDLTYEKEENMSSSEKTVVIGKGKTNRYYGVYLQGMNLKEYIQKCLDGEPGYPLRDTSISPLMVIAMPCGERAVYRTIEDMPEGSVPCSCGDPTHWFVFVDR